MKRRDFLIGAASMLFFPQDAFAKTVVREERTFGRKQPNIVENNLWDETETDFEPTEPYIVDTDLILMEDSMDKREVTNRLIIHHTGNMTDIDMSARDAHLLHKYEFGWAGIGYHYVIRKSGVIEAGRPENMVGAHALSNNMDSIGIVLSGNFNIGEPTDNQMESLINLTSYLAYKYDLDLKEPGVLQGHKDVCDTECPGANMYYRLDSVRSLTV